jgi:tetratricopeptide (TPR) repeat protein
VNRVGRKLVVALTGGLMLLSVGLYWATRVHDGLPVPGSPLYEDVSRAFYRGLAAFQVGLLDNARQDFLQATSLVPAEPAAWANLGLTELRRGQIDSARQALDRAAEWAPENSDIRLLQGQAESARGRLDEAISYFRRAVDLGGDNLRARFALAQEIERASGPNADVEALSLMDDLLTLQPENLAVLLEVIRLTAKIGDGSRLSASINRLEMHQVGWPAAAIEQYRALQRAGETQNVADAARAVLSLRNVLTSIPVFREGLARIRTPSELVGEAFVRFLRLPSADARPSPADEALMYSVQPFGGEPPTPWTASITLSVDGTEAPATFAAAGGVLQQIDGPGSRSQQGLPSVFPTKRGLLAVDWNNDFRSDLVFAGSGGVQILVRSENGTLIAASERLFTTDAVGAWAADVEMDGDLDIVVGLVNGGPAVLRNNGDNTWSDTRPFAGVMGIRDFAWGDLDQDGDPDAAFLDDSGDVRLFANRQAGEFTLLGNTPALGERVALTVGDVNADGVLDVATVDRSGVIRRASATPTGWEEEQLATWPDLPAAVTPGAFRLFTADLDNNGALDLLGTAEDKTRLWLADETSRLRPIAPVLDAEIFSVVDIDNDGQLDLVGLAAGRPVRFLGRGTKNYHWQVIRPRAQAAAGDQRINSFGIGGDIEIRSGLLTQKQTIADTLVHFGLGTRTSIDVTRIGWPNGVVQAEFAHAADQLIVAEQRLKGSCPWLFTYDGTGMRFVTDFLWRSPLGLRINAQDTAGTTQTEDWVKVQGDQLRPRDGFYDIRITAELWETHFIDHLSLMVVDHPGDVEVFVDERFAVPAPAMTTHATRTPRAVSRAWDPAGNDVTGLVDRKDGRYLAAFRPGLYQGVAEDHFVEFELGQPIGQVGPFWLIAHGWVYPTDSSINVAIGQGQHARPRGLSLEARDEAGRWVVVLPDVGFPAGKNKTMLIDLRPVVEAGLDRARRFRLRTNMEVSWDWLGSAAGVENSVLRTTRLRAERAALRYRGFSVTRDVRGNAPETPAYDTIANTSPRWRDLTGYYTRFGDTLELIDEVDDRYVIMNAGDELQVAFPAPAPSESGWRRDFVLIGDGWEKDGDYNTSFSKTVLPLPSHGRPRYEATSTLELEDDPVYQQHDEDWRTYHTRFVSPDRYLKGLRLH